MKANLLWLVKRWALIPLAAFVLMAVLSFAGLRGPKNADKYFEDRPYDGAGISWQLTPGSSCFSAVGYDEENETLAVIFRSNESRTYLYTEFCAADYTDFMTASSLGSYYNQNIKGQFPSERIDETAGTNFEP